MSVSIEARKDEGARKRRVPLWLVVVIAAALGIAVALLFPNLSKAPF